MTKAPDVDQSYQGSGTDRQHPMPAKPGSHVSYARGRDLVVEWYDFGNHAPYESANMLVFDQDAQDMLAKAIGADLSLPVDMLATRVAARFASYFEVQQFAVERHIPFRKEVDFQP